MSTIRLKNFLEDSSLNHIRELMGAPLSSFGLRVSVPPPIFTRPVDPPRLKPLPPEGLDVSADEFKWHQDGTVIYKNRRVVVHIRDATNHTPKFHISNCSTLVDMKNQGRIQRYVVSERTDGNFFVRFNSGSLVKKRLAVCQNCLDKLSWRNFSRDDSANARMAIVSSFSLAEFFLKYPASLIPLVSRHHSTPAETKTHPENWLEISNEYKKQMGYYCQDCYKVLGNDFNRFLHVIQLNGRKDDCNVANLRSVCVSCLAKRPDFSNVVGSSDHREFKQLFG